MQNKIFKRNLSLLLVLVMMLSLFPVQVLSPRAYAEEINEEIVAETEALGNVPVETPNNSSVDVEAFDVEELTHEVQEQNGEETVNTEENSAAEESVNEDSAVEVIEKNWEASEILFRFFKSDAKQDAFYSIRAYGPEMFQYNSKLFQEPMDENSLFVKYRDVEENLIYNWIGDSEKSVNYIFDEEVLKMIGIWEIDADFSFQTFMMAQDGQDLAEYIIFFFREKGSDQIRYIICSLNSIFTEEDLEILFAEYKKQEKIKEDESEIDKGKFIDIEDVEAENILNLRDVFSENLQYIVCGEFFAAESRKVAINLEGPQLVEIQPEEDSVDYSVSEIDKMDIQDNNPEPQEEQNEGTVPSEENSVEKISGEVKNVEGEPSDDVSDEAGDADTVSPAEESQVIKIEETEEDSDSVKEDETSKSAETNVSAESEKEICVAEPEVLEPIVEEQTEEFMPENPAEYYLSEDQLMNNTLALTEAGMEAAKEKGLIIPSKKVMSIMGNGVLAQTPVTADGITIEKISARWLSQGAGYNDLNLAPTTDIAPNQQWQVDFALSGKGTVDAGAIEIVIPAYIWRDRDGKEPGHLTLAIPQEPDTSNDFAWKRVGDTIVITNTHVLSAGSKYMVQGTFRMTYPDPNSDRAFDTTYAHQMVDGTVSNDFFAVLNVLTPRTNEIIGMTSNAIKAKIDTYVKAAAASKTAVNKTVYYEKPSNLPTALTPTNPENYIYVQWYIDGHIEGNQPFTMTFKDTVVNKAWKMNNRSHEYEEFPVNGLLLGASYTADGTVVSTDKENVSGKLFDGYSTVDKSAYVWVAYPKSAFSEEGATYKLKNTDTVVVTGTDDKIVTTKDATGEVSFRMPITWKIDKIWNDDNNSRGRRPEKIKTWIENKSIAGHPTVATYQLSDANQWHAEYVDDGSVSNYECYEVNYYVSQSTAYEITGGYGDWVEFENGSKYRVHWWYSREKTEYNETTHTWTFTNKYHEAVVWAYIAELAVEKHATNHTNNYQKATSDKDLRRLLKGQETTPLSYSVYAHTFVLPYTIAEGADPSDVSKHGQRYVTLELRDYDEYLESRKLNANEYRIDFVYMRDPIIKNWVPSGNTDTGNGGYLMNTGSLQETSTIPVSLYGYRNGEWKQYATLENGVVLTMNGATANGRAVTFPEDMEEVKESLRTNGAYAELQYDVNVIIYPTDEVVADVNRIFESTDYGMARSFNRDEAILYNGDGDEVMRLDRRDATFLHGRIYRVAEDLDKSVEFAESNRTTRNLRFVSIVTLTQQSNITESSDWTEAVRSGDVDISKSGYFYDLLPAGMTADVNSVKLSNGKILTADVIENYKGSGRQMLVVKVKLGGTYDYRQMYTADSHYGDGTYPESGYGMKHTLTFDMLYSYDEAQNRGLIGLRNHAAYEADEAAFGNLNYWTGETDTPYGANHKESTQAVYDPSVVSLMTDLDPNRNDPSFVYAGANVNVTELDFSALTSITKHVQVVGSDRWSYGHENDVNVYEGGKYSYKIQLTSGADTQTKDIIILDSLENYILKSGDDDYNGGTQWAWQGSFMSIDISEIETVGVDPVVYYNTTENLNIDGYNPEHTDTAVMNILGGNGWTTTMPADPSTVKAIAIDCRHKTDGSDFLLEEGKALIAYVYMKAPTWYTDPNAFDETEYSNHLRNAHAYNNVFMDVTQIDEVGGVTHSYDHFDYTKVGIMGFDLSVVKEWNDLADNDRIRPTEITAHLYANDEDTGRIAVLNAEDSWKGTITHVLPFDDDGKQIRYSLVDEVEGYTCSSYMSGNRIVLTNFHDPEKVSIPFTKTWESDERGDWMTNIPKSITVRLMKNGTYSGKSLTIRQAIDGTWSGSFNDLLKYDKGVENVYTVEETPIDGFITSYDGYHIQNVYYPYGDLVVEKQVIDGTDAALNTIFYYTLILKDKEGSALTGKYNYKIYDADDVVQDMGVLGNGDTFYLYDDWKCEVKNIPSGSTYQVLEDDAAGFTLTDKINDMGKIVAGVTSNAKFENTYAANGETSIRMEKELSGRDLARYQFQFRIYNEDNVVIRAASNTADGNIEFGALRYTNYDDGHEFTYTIKEDNKEKPGYTYDSSVYVVKVTPRDLSDGTMECIPHFFATDSETGEVTEEIEKIVWKNTYKAEGDLTLRAWKTLQARTLQDGEFAFELLNSNGKIIQTSTNTADGSVVFDPIHLTEANVGQKLYYFVREVPGTDPTVNYDGTVYGYEIEVVDNGDGTLSFIQGFVDPNGRFETCEWCGGDGIATSIYPVDLSYSIDKYLRFPDSFNNDGGEIQGFAMIKFTLRSVDEFAEEHDANKSIGRYGYAQLLPYGTSKGYDEYNEYDDEIFEPFVKLVMRKTLKYHDAGGGQVSHNYSAWLEGVNKDTGTLYWNDGIEYKWNNRKMGAEIIQTDIITRPDNVIYYYTDSYSRSPSGYPSSENNHVATIYEIQNRFYETFDEVIDRSGDNGAVNNFAWRYVFYGDVSGSNYVGNFENDWLYDGSVSKVVFEETSDLYGDGTMIGKELLDFVSNGAPIVLNYEDESAISVYLGEPCESHMYVGNPVDHRRQEGSTSVAEIIENMEHEPGYANLFYNELVNNGGLTLRDVNSYWMINPGDIGEWNDEKGDWDLVESIDFYGITPVLYYPSEVCEHCEGSGVVKNPNWKPKSTEELSVFKNTLKDGGLSITKRVTASDPTTIDPSQEFNFKVVLIGPDVEDGTVSFTRKKVSG